MAINMTIQGTAADIMKIAMRGSSRLAKIESRGARLLQAHDELVRRSRATRSTGGPDLREEVGTAYFVDYARVE